MSDYVDYFDPDLDRWGLFITSDLPSLAHYFTLLLVPIGIGACIMCISQLRRSLFPKDIRRFLYLFRQRPLYI